MQQENIRQQLYEWTVADLTSALVECRLELGVCCQKQELAERLADHLSKNQDVAKLIMTYCSICSTHKPVDGFWPLRCGHFVCVACLKRHLEVQVLKMRYTRHRELECPFGPNCSEHIHVDDAKLFSALVLPLWRDLGRREELIQRAANKYPVLECPQPECVGVAFEEAGCQTAMCFLCEHQWATGQGTATASISLPTGLKACPKCQIPIEKMGGCDHMHCTRCNNHFSWRFAKSQIAEPFERIDVNNHSEVVAGMCSRLVLGLSFLFARTGRGGI